MNGTNKLTAKQVSELLNVSVSTAYRYMKDIKEEYNLKVVTFSHYQKYFKIYQN